MCRLNREENEPRVPEVSYTEFLNIALEAAYLGGRRTLGYFNSGVAVEWKRDNTPVTIADKEAERLIRGHLAKYFPDHSILGEEEGITAGNPEYRWIIDPIDGTKTFIHGVPLYGVLIGLEIRGRAEVGVVYMPALDEMVYAARGEGCRWNGRLARVSRVSALEEATLLCTSPTSATKRSDAYEILAAKTRLQRNWGDCYGHILVATGRAEIMLDPAMNPWDCAPLLPILEEAGGHFTTWAAEATIHGPDAVSTNAAVHQETLAILKSELRR